MESEEILGPQFSVHWSTCSPIPGKRFPITDAKMTGISRMLKRDKREGSWTDFNRLFERYLLKGEIFTLQNKSDEEQKKEEKQQRLFST